MEQSQRSGAGADETYIPNVWYFDTLEFLRDQETQIPGFSTIDIGEAEETEKAEVSNFNYVYSNLSLYAYLLSFFPNQNVLFSFYSVFSLFLWKFSKNPVPKEKCLLSYGNKKIK